MADLIKHRGPDSDGYYIDSDIAMGFRRLSIIDLSNFDASKEPGFLPRLFLSFLNSISAVSSASLIITFFFSDLNPKILHNCSLMIMFLSLLESLRHITYFRNII